MGISVGINSGAALPQPANGNNPSMAEPISQKKPSGAPQPSAAPLPSPAPTPSSMEQSGGNMFVGASPFNSQTSIFSDNSPTAASLINGASKSVESAAPMSATNLHSTTQAVKSVNSAPPAQDLIFNPVKNTYVNANTGEESTASGVGKGTYENIVTGAAISGTNSAGATAAQQAQQIAQAVNLSGKSTTAMSLQPSATNTVTKTGPFTGTMDYNGVNLLGTYGSNGEFNVNNGQTYSDSTGTYTTYDNQLVPQYVPGTSYTFHGPSNQAYTVKPENAEQYYQMATNAKGALPSAIGAGFTGISQQRVSAPSPTATFSLPTGTYSLPSTAFSNGNTYSFTQGGAPYIATLNGNTISVQLDTSSPLYALYMGNMAAQQGNTFYKAYTDYQQGNPLTSAETLLLQQYGVIPTVLAPNSNSMYGNFENPTSTAMLGVSPDVAKTYSELVKVSPSVAASWLASQQQPLESALSASQASGRIPSQASQQGISSSNVGLRASTYLQSVNPYNPINWLNTNINNLASTPYNPGDIASLPYWEHQAGVLLALTRNFVTNPLGSFASVPQHYTNAVNIANNMVKQGQAPWYFPIVVQEMMLAPVQATGVGLVGTGAVPAAAVGSIARQAALGAAIQAGAGAVLQGQTSPGELIQNALLGATAAGAGAELVEAAPIQQAITSIVTRPAIADTLANLASSGRLGSIAATAIAYSPQAAREAVNFGTWSAVAQGLSSMANGQVPSAQEIGSAFATGAAIGAIFPEVGPLMRAATETASPTLISTITNLIGKIGAYSGLNVGANYLAGSPLPAWQAAAIGAGLPIGAEYASSLYGLGKAGLTKLVLPETTSIGTEFPAGSDVYAEVQTAEGPRRIYRGTTQEMQPLNDLQQQVKDSITAPADYGTATGIHLTLNKDVLDSLKNGGTLTVSAPASEGAGFRNVFTNPEYGNPLYVAPSKLEGVENVQQAYGGYVGLSDNAESGGKVTNAQPGKYYGVKIDLTPENTLLGTDYAKLSGTEDQLRALQDAASQGRTTDPQIKADMQDYYNRYADYARSQGDVIVAPENLFLPSGETQLIVPAGTVLEGTGEPIQRVFTIGQNQGLFKNVPVLQNIVPTTTEGVFTSAQPMPTLLTTEQLAAQNPAGSAASMQPAVASASAYDTLTPSQLQSLYSAYNTASPTGQAMISGLLTQSANRQQNLNALNSQYMQQLYNQFGQNAVKNGVFTYPTQLKAQPSTLTNLLSQRTALQNGISSLQNRLSALVPSKQVRMASKVKLEELRKDLDRYLGKLVTMVGYVAHLSITWPDENKTEDPGRSVFDLEEKPVSSEKYVVHNRAVTVKMVGFEVEKGERKWDILAEGQKVKITGKVSKDLAGDIVIRPVYEQTENGRYYKARLKHGLF